MKSIHETIDGTNLVAGENTLNGTAVNPGKIQEITNITYSYTGTVAGVRIKIMAGGKIIQKTDADPVSGQTDEWNGKVCLNAGEKISVVVTGVALNDDFTADVNGSEKEA